MLDALGLAPPDVDAALADLKERALVRAGLTAADVDAAIAERAAARAAKDFAAADAVRRRLEEAGLALLDTPAGTSWQPAGGEE